MKKSPVYTRRGDDGTTGLVGGTRISKGHIRLECYGTIDELNSHIGVLLAEELTDETHDFLLRLQHILFNVAGSLATPPDQEEYLAAMQIDPTDIEKLEHKIDELDATGAQDRRARRYAPTSQGVRPPLWWTHSSTLSRLSYRMPSC